MCVSHSVSLIHGWLGSAVKNVIRKWLDPIWQFFDYKPNEWLLVMTCCSLTSFFLISAKLVKSEATWQDVAKYPKSGQPIKVIFHTFSSKWKQEECRCGNNVRILDQSWYHLTRFIKQISTLAYYNLTFCTFKLKDGCTTILDSDFVAGPAMPMQTPHSHHGTRGQPLLRGHWVLGRGQVSSEGVLHLPSARRPLGPHPVLWPRMLLRRRHRFRTQAWDKK